MAEDRKEGNSLKCPGEQNTGKIHIYLPSLFSSLVYYTSHSIFYLFSCIFKRGY